MFHPALVGLAFLIVVASGAAQGLWSGRWQPPRALERARTRIEHVPQRVGSWVLDEERPVSLKERQIGGIVGYKSRLYTHRGTGQSVSVLLVCGRPGSIAVHTPDVCFEGAGFRRTGTPARTGVLPAESPQQAEFWKANFSRPEAGIPVPLLVYWSWSPTGTWAAPDNPRLAYWDEPVLFKLYVSRLVSGEETESEPCLDFLRVFLPALQEALFAEQPPDGERGP